MKERIVYRRINDPEKLEPFWIYYKIKQYLTWRFYIRIIQDKGWFTPCDQCQKKITKVWNEEFFLLIKRGQIDGLVGWCFRRLCTKCMVVIRKKLRDCPVIVGNVKYKPWIELNRAWIEDDNSIENVTKEEYDTHVHPAFREVEKNVLEVVQD